MIRSRCPGMSTKERRTSEQKHSCDWPLLIVYTVNRYARWLHVILSCLTLTKNIFYFILFYFCLFAEQPPFSLTELLSIFRPSALFSTKVTGLLVMSGDRLFVAPRSGHDPDIQSLVSLTPHCVPLRCPGKVNYVSSHTVLTKKNTFAGEFCKLEVCISKPANILWTKYRHIVATEV